MPLTAAGALLPVTFLAIHLTNRRFGASYAFAQLGIAWTLVLAVLPSLERNSSHMPDLRILLGFGAGLILGQAASITVFEGMRGPRWWKAPVFASLIGGLVLSLVAFPLAFAGEYADWPREMFGYAGISTASAVLLLLPYALLRPLIPPRPGFGGY